MSLIRTPVAALVVYPNLSWTADRAGNLWHAPTAEWQTDWVQLVETAAKRFREQGVIVVRHRDSSTLGERVTDLKARLHTGGWKVHGTTRRTGWFTLLKRGEPAMSFGILDFMDASRQQALFDVHGPADRIARALGAYHGATGTRWCGTGGMSGCNLVRTMPRNDPPRWHWKGASRCEAVGCSMELLKDWPSHNLPDDWHVQHWDTRGGYLAAAGVAMIGYGCPEPRGAQQFDPDQPGYWKIDTRTLPDPAGILHRAPGPDGTTWTTTPVLRYVTEDLGEAPPAVVDSFTCLRGGRILRSWAEQLTRARFEHPAVEAAVKDTYSRTVGMFASDGGRIHRPDWRDIIVDTSRVNLLRKTRGRGQILRYRTDGVWMATPFTDPRPWTDTGRIGQLRHEATMTMTEYRDRYERTPA